MNEDQFKTLLHSGLSLHRQGKFQEARTVYEQVLLEQPRNFDALHLMGVIFFQEKKIQHSWMFIPTC